MTPLKPTRATLDRYCRDDPAGMNVEDALTSCKQFGWCYPKSRGRAGSYS